jgi:hypothetical protein
MMGLFVVVGRPSLCRLDIEVALQKRSTMEGRYGGTVPSVLIEAGLAVRCFALYLRRACGVVALNTIA